MYQQSLLRLPMQYAAPSLKNPSRIATLIYSHKRKGIKLESESFFSLSCKIDNFTSQLDHSYPAIYEDSHHLLFKMSMGLFLKFWALEVFSRVKNFLFWRLRCRPLNCQKLAHLSVRCAINC